MGAQELVKKKKGKEEGKSMGKEEETIAPFNKDKLLINLSHLTEPPLRTCV